MPKFQNELLEAQKKLIGAQIEELEALMEMDPDNPEYLAQLEALEAEMRGIQEQRKAYRSQQQEVWKANKGKKPKGKLEGKAHRPDTDGVIADMKTK